MRRETEKYFKTWSKNNTVSRMDVEDHIINEHATHFMAMLVAVYRKASKIAAQMTAEGILPEPEVSVGTIEFLHCNNDTFEEQ